LKRPARFDAELLVQGFPGLPVYLQGISLPARAVEGEHELSTQPLAQGVVTDQRLEFTHQVAGSALRELRLDALLQCVQT
jgi:hypothetical protein